MPDETAYRTNAVDSISHFNATEFGRGRQLVTMLGLMLVAALVFSSCGGSGEKAAPDPSSESRNGSTVTSGVVTPAPTPQPTPAPDPVLVGAGDITSCTQENDVLTAGLLDTVISSAAGEAVVFTAGDNVYQDGTIEEYEQCYHPTWGRHRDRTRPAPGNHEYGTGNADGYFTYFGAVFVQRLPKRCHIRGPAVKASRGEQWVVPDRQRACRGMGCEVGAKPFLLR